MSSRTNPRSCKNSVPTYRAYITSNLPVSRSFDSDKRHLSRIAKQDNEHGLALHKTASPYSSDEAQSLKVLTMARRPLTAVMSLICDSGG